LVERAMRDLMPRAHGLPGIADTDVRLFLRNVRREADAFYRVGLWLGALLYQLSPLLTIGVPLPASLLPSSLRERHVQRATTHRFYAYRQAINLVRLNAGMCWGADPAVRERFALAAYPKDPGSFRT
jgi:hypothetical protein